MSLDRTKPFAEIIGATNGVRFHQDGIDYDINGDAIGSVPVVAVEEHSAPAVEHEKRKPGRPRKDVA